MPSLSILEWLCLVPVIAGSVFHMLCVVTTARWRLRKPDPPPPAWPPVSVVKPIAGLEKNLLRNLRSTADQDYPDFQVIFSVQRRDDPALLLLEQVQREFGPERVVVAVDEQQAGANGKINNMLGAMPHVRHEYLVISDSDVQLERGYLKAIVAPLFRPGVGYVCTPYKAACADSWYEKMELLSLNADFMPSVVFAYETRVSGFCLGASIALRTKVIEEIGGIASLADYLVEDYELGRRISELGYGRVLAPPVIDTMVDLQSPRKWWKHQVYWDQNTRAARPVAFFSTLLIRSIPFGLIFAALRRFDALGLAVFAGALLIRVGAAAAVLGWGFRDREGMRALPLLPARDFLGFASWLLSFVQGTTHWRGKDYILTRDGRLLHKHSEAKG
ncbi:MAG: glycosyltransferase [Bryobacteraceae bacterium]|nr:glycosyltransferase [Bryobacteraceae bacterium]